MPVDTPITPAAVPPASAPPATALASPPAVKATTSEAPKTDLGLTTAVSGIISDFQKLMTQQVALLKAELIRDWAKSKRAMAPMIVGAMFLAGAALMLAMTGAYALHWAFAPPDTDPSRLPLWACFGIVGLTLVVAGGGLVMLGVWAFQSFNPLPDETAAAFEQNVKALTEPRATPSM